MACKAFKKFHRSILLLVCCCPCAKLFMLLLLLLLVTMPYNLREMIKKIGIIFAAHFTLLCVWVCCVAILHFSDTNQEFQKFHWIHILLHDWIQHVKIICMHTYSVHFITWPHWHTHRHGHINQICMDSSPHNRTQFLVFFSSLFSWNGIPFHMHTNWRHSPI